VINLRSLEGRARFFFVKTVGTVRAFGNCMAGVKRFEDLIAWQRSVELRDDVTRATETGLAARDMKFREQIRDSSRSAPRNIAEGFAYFKPKQFAKYLRVARGSLAETRNHLLDGRSNGYFDQEDAARMLRLCSRATIATTRLLEYVESCKGQAPTGWDAGADGRKSRQA
jgi:four helix bundle protein